MRAYVCVCVRMRNCENFGDTVSVFWLTLCKYIMTVHWMALLQGKFTQILKSNNPFRLQHSDWRPSGLFIQVLTYLCNKSTLHNTHDTYFREFGVFSCSCVPDGRNIQKFSFLQHERDMMSYDTHQSHNKTNAFTYKWMKMIEKKLLKILKKQEKTKTTPSQ